MGTKDPSRIASHQELRASVRTRGIMTVSDWRSRASGTSLLIELQADSRIINLAPFC